MPSSTSNFEKVPAGLPFGRIFAAALLVAAGAIYYAERYVREHGGVTNVTNTMALWAAKRSEVYTSRGRKKIVIAGSSRSQLGLVPDSFRRAFPEMDVVHLGLVEKSCYAVMEDLAEDPRFDGWIVCDIIDPYYVDRRAQPHVRYYHDRYGSFSRVLANMDEHWHASIRALLQSRLALLSARMFPGLLFGQVARPSNCGMDLDRFMPANYRALKPQTLEKVRSRLWRRLNWPPNPYQGGKRRGGEKFAKGPLKRIGDLMRAKGGRVFLVRMPTSEELLDIQEISFPKWAWEAAASTADVHGIHFMNDPILSAIRCPDRSHLDRADAVVFSDRVAELMKIEIAEESRRP